MWTGLYLITIFGTTYCKTDSYMFWKGYGGIRSHDACRFPATTSKSDFGNVSSLRATFWAALELEKTVKFLRHK